ncbi:hypothetical protein TNCV_153191 [Trichonephila clavipes]|nr:hypothetical protein TNCV_153191 [Trichonephila clavipes]
MLAWCGSLEMCQSSDVVLVTLSNCGIVFPSLGKPPTETYWILLCVYEGQVLSMKCVYVWFTRFREGRESVSDNFRSKRPATSVSDENMEKLHERFRRQRPRNFEPWSSDEDDTGAGTLSPNFHTTPTRGRLCSRQIQRASLPYTAGLYWYWARTRDMPATIRYLDH